MKSLPCAVFFLCCTHRRVTRAQEYTVISLETGIVPISAPVEVSCVFTNQWTSQRHPLAYPPAARARWSPMILASHSSDYTMWANGDIASPAIQTLAETGDELPLMEELENSSTDVLDKRNGTAMKATQQQPQLLDPLRVDLKHPYISSVTKISPSPDWFSGFAALTMINSTTDTWFSSFEVETYPFDAGTDSGKAYRARENVVTEPQGNITRIEVGKSGEGLPKAGVFVNPNGTTVLPVAKWTCSVGEAVPASTASPSSVTSRQVNAQGYTVVSTEAGTIPSTQDVKLSCEFTNQWTEERHPLAYPTANAHWSPMILASHSSDYTMWAEGQLASSELQVVAETGVKLGLIAALENSTDVLDSQSGRAQYIAQQQTQSLPALIVNANHSLISSTTKISPSPDWFTGFADFNVIDNASNTWLDSFDIDTYPLDAGTDSGLSYRSEDNPTVPPREITQILVDEETAVGRGLPREGIFVSPDGNTILPVAKWVCSTAAIASPTAAPVASVDPTAAPDASAPDVSMAPTAAQTTLTPSGAPTVAPILPPTASPTDGTTEASTDVTTKAPTPGPTDAIIPYFVSITKGDVPSSTNIGVTCTFMNEWTISRHPPDYPTDKASWSPMVVASHSQEFQMWENGQPASAGVRSLSMTGNTGLMLGELMISDKGVLDYRGGSSINVSVRQNQTIAPVRLHKDHPFISTIAAIQPSPDWFSGFYNFNFIDPATDRWYENVVIEAFPWDAGTDSGDTYEAPVDLTIPAYLITQLTPKTIPDTDVFLSSDGEVLPVSRWTCSRVDPPTLSQKTSGVRKLPLHYAFLASFGTTILITLL